MKLNLILCTEHHVYYNMSNEFSGLITSSHLGMYSIWMMHKKLGCPQQRKESTVIQKNLWVRASWCPSLECNVIGLGTISLTHWAPLCKLKLICRPLQSWQFLEILHLSTFRDLDPPWTKNEEVRLEIVRTWLVLSSRCCKDAVDVKEPWRYNSDIMLQMLRFGESRSRRITS